MANPKTSTSQVADPFTFERLAELPSLDAIDEVPTALAALAIARRREGEAEAALAQARQDAATNPDPRTRRRTARAIDDFRDALEDARDGIAQASRDLATARGVVFERVAPIIRAAHVGVLMERFAPALRALEAACHELIAIERVAGNLMRPSESSFGKSESALPAGEVGDLVLASVERFDAVIAAHRPATAA